MRTRLVSILIVLSVALGACSIGSREKAASRPSPTTAARAVPTRAASPTAAPSPTADRADAIYTAVAELGGTPTPAAPDVAALTPGPKPEEKPKTIRDFGERVRASLRALEDLPGYTYTVRPDPLEGYPAGGLELFGTVAAPDRRTWTVYERGEPAHVLARWALVGRKKYTDISGVWRETRSLPFEARAPISFALGEENALFDSFGTLNDSSRSEAFVSSRPGIQYTITRQLGADAEDPDYAGVVAVDHLTVAEEGGYLLGYSGLQTVEVTPLGKAPPITPPKVGVAVWKGNPPPWRALLTGRLRLMERPSYRFVTEEDTYGLKLRASGQVASRQGRLRGRAPDFYAEEPEPYDPRKVKMVDLEMVYTGGKVWTRKAGARWQRAVTSLEGEAEPDENALTLLGHLPAPPPAVLVGSAATAEEFFSYPLYGVPDVGGAVVLVDARLVGTEMVNGVRALHYKGGANGGEFEDDDAEVWLAEDGHYLVRARFSFASEYDAPAGSIEQVRYDVYDAGKPFEVRPPNPKQVAPPDDGERTEASLPRG